MAEESCTACKATGALECASLRYGTDILDEDEPCECECHFDDEDEDDDWSEELPL